MYINCEVFLRILWPIFRPVFGRTRPSNAAIGRVLILGIALTFPLHQYRMYRLLSDGIIVESGDYLMLELQSAYRGIALFSNLVWTPFGSVVFTLGIAIRKRRLVVFLECLKKHNVICVHILFVAFYRVRQFCCFVETMAVPFVLPEDDDSNEILLEIYECLTVLMQELQLRRSREPSSQITTRGK